MPCSIHPPLYRNLSTARYFTPRRQALLLFVLFLLTPLGAQAQNANPPLHTAFQLQQFRPWGDTFGMFQTQSGRTLGQWHYQVGMFLNYSNNILVLQQGNRLQPLMEHQFGLDVVAGVGFLDWFDLYLAIPMSLYQVGRIPNDTNFSPEDRNKDLTGFALSDIKLNLKFQALREKKHAINLGFQLFVGLPTGDTIKMGGEEPVSFGAALFLSKQISIVNLALNFGYRFLPLTDRKSVV